MLGWTSKPKTRRQQVRSKSSQKLGPRARQASRLLRWPLISSVLFVALAAGITLVGRMSLPYSVGQRIEHPVYALVDFQVPDPEQTENKRQAARASTPSYYRWNAFGVTFDRIRADLRSLYEAAASSETFEDFTASTARLGIEADESAYGRLRMLVDMPDSSGREKLNRFIEEMPFDKEFVVKGLLSEPRTPTSTAGFIVLEEAAGEGGEPSARQIPLTELVRQETEKALRGSAAELSRPFPFAIRGVVEQIVLKTLKEQPTIVYNSERTLEAMRKAEESTAVAMATYERGKPFVTSTVLGSDDYKLLRAHHWHYLAFLEQDLPAEEAAAEQRTLQAELRQHEWLRQVGMTTLVALLSAGLFVYTGLHQPRVFERKTGTLAFAGLILGTLLAARLLHLRWPHIPELVLMPCLLAGSVLAIVYPRRFALGAICMVAVVVAATIRANLAMLLVLFTGVTVAVFQLDEIRSRTKIITAGTITAAAVMVVSAAGGLHDGHSLLYLRDHALTAGACALMAAFVVSGLLPFIERTFGIATSLTLLEWRDPTRPLLQLLAREAPGTYNHSLVLGTLVESACERIGANALLAQVGALYHDIGKIPKADYFTENQEGQINRHDRLAPTMSLLIILGHVKDGIEMAKEYKLPKVLRHFIEEHHGTTVVRYFHHVASEKQPHIASGRHDREVPEAEFRYPGPKPRTKESAALMLADSVEGAVRSLQDPTVGRIESVVHQIVQDRLADGQFGDCDITMRELRQVEESLVKSLCSIYHGRVAYPKARKEAEEPSDVDLGVPRKRLSG